MLRLAEKSEEPKTDSPLNILVMGPTDYRNVLQMQLQMVEQRQQEKIPNTVLIVEHTPVITLGARQTANRLLTPRVELEQRQIDVIDIRRGGGATAHNPGQLVVYPIINIKQLGLDVGEYIRALEDIGIELLEQLGVQSRRKRGMPGLWVGSKKIASIGVHIARFVTYHGIAINIQNDLSIFDSIVPCGIEGVKMTSVLEQTGKQFSMGLLKGKLSQLLINQFSAFPTQQAIRRLPRWLHRPLPAGAAYTLTSDILKSLNMETICVNANCPNRGECWQRGTATALILGNICTRNCKFCSVPKGKPAPPDTEEPMRLAQMTRQLGLKYLVITSVDRDDLPDGGASHFRDCINIVRQNCPDAKFEILTPDFRNCQQQALEILREALPFVFAHNIETVSSLYKIARAGGNYQESLNLLKMAKEKFPGIQTKSSIMLGLGETDEEVEQTLKDLRAVGCDRITIGQYLRPSKNSLPVTEFVTPKEFDTWRQKALELGFSWVMSSPFTRSSYFAEQQNTSQPLPAPAEK